LQEHTYMASSAEETRIRSLVQQSERAYAARDSRAAMQLLFEAQKLAPDHPLVLNAAGLQALDSGHAAQANELFRRATEHDESNPGFWVNLATSFRRLQKPDEEAQALERALAIDPRHLLALLQKAALTRLRGDPRRAALIYKNALATIPSGVQLPEGLRKAVEAAQEAVRANAEALSAELEERLRGIRAAHRNSQHDRFDHGIDALLGRKRIYQPEPTQLHFPKLPALEFYPRQEFPWLAALETATREIQAEFERVFLEDQNRLEPYIAYPEGVPLDQWAELNRSRRWSAFFLWRDGKAIEENLARCPRTAELLRAAPMHDVSRHAPTAFFSILDAKTHIPAHTGVTNTRVIVHLPLVIPAGCRFRVGSETREWRTGEAWVFDDTIEHEAWNDSDVPRAILIFDIWNPFLTQAERELVREAMQGIADYYGGNPVTGL
jgi:aspartate beta-hydroxylase